MADWHVPTRFRPALIQFAGLDDDVVAELATLLESNPEILTSRDTAHEYAARLKKIGADDGSAILDAIVPLLFYKASSADSNQTVLKGLVGALRHGNKTDEKLQASQVPKFEKNFSRLLDLAGIVLKAKALSLATDCPRIFSDTKIITDIRPVFGSDISKFPLGASVLHSLKISYAENGKEREFFVQMDIKDLKELQEWATRAIEKDVSLKSFLNQNKLEIFETSTSHD